MNRDLRWRIALLALIVLIRGSSDAHAGDAAPEYPSPVAVKAAFLKLLDRPKVASDPRNYDEPTMVEGLATEHLSIATEKKSDGSVERMPMLIVRPQSPRGRLPAVIVLHGTGGNKEGERGLCVELAKHEMIGVAIDARYHGERITGGAHGAKEYVDAITRAWRAKTDDPLEHPFYFDTCWDLWRLIDYLDGRADIDPERIGMIGFSMGGIETWLAASVDERVRVAIPAIGVQSLRYSLEHDLWQGRAGTIQGAHEAAAKDLGEPEVNGNVCRALWSKVVPGILDQFDCPSMLRLFAGRPLLILNGDKDPNNPLGGAKLAFAAAELAYRDSDAGDKLEIDVAPNTGHAVTRKQHDKAVAWLERWLKAGK